MKNRGFSLVELIIVIAILAVLTGLLAPTYMKFVFNSKVTADVANANNIADVINAAIAEAPEGTIDTSFSGTGGTSIDGVNGLTELPYSKYDRSFSWSITCDDEFGVDEITLGSKVIYSRTGDSSEYYNAYYK